MQGVIIKRDDLSEPTKIAAAINGSEVVISAYAPPKDDPEAIVGTTQRLIDALSGGTSARLIVVGGAGGLFVAPGVTLVDSGHLPEPFLPISRAHVKALNVLRVSTIDWDLPGAGRLFYAGRAHGQISPGAKTSSLRMRSRRVASRWRTTRLRW